MAKRKDTAELKRGTTQLPKIRRNQRLSPSFFSFGELFFDEKMFHKSSVHHQPQSPKCCFLALEVQVQGRKSGADKGVSQSLSSCPSVTDHGGSPCNRRPKQEKEEKNSKKKKIQTRKDVIKRSDVRLIDHRRSVKSYYPF